MEMVREEGSIEIPRSGRRRKERKDGWG
ncbi:uncharacterized protein G2W53_036512 [Senna tora]|uniref:Uncharacterized protein n=1 Tax=Senna tora TaxID=362788 RepID=A0A834STM5_9FABA|nr:uncharacterized protein G2W53_036512 [Senna tora]